MIGAAGEKQVTSIEQLAGEWYGYYRRPWGQEIRANVSIDGQGRAKFVFQGNPTFYSTLEIRDGVLRHGSVGYDARGWGTAKLVEERGTEYLTFFLPDGTLWVECERAK